MDLLRMRKVPLSSLLTCERCCPPDMDDDEDKERGKEIPSRAEKPPVSRMIQSAADPCVVSRIFSQKFEIWFCMIETFWREARELLRPTFGLTRSIVVRSYSGRYYILILSYSQQAQTFLVAWTYKSAQNGELKWWSSHAVLCKTKWTSEMIISRSLAPGQISLLVTHFMRRSRNPVPQHLTHFA